MRILRMRCGFQADHSSSSYLFYAVDQPVSSQGQRIAHRFSSRAEVGRRSARYLKWGERELDPNAYKILLGKHYDVMVSESYGWWTWMIAVPKTAETKRLLAPFRNARGYDDLGVEVLHYGSRLVAVVYCALVDDGAEFAYEHEDVHSYLVKLLTRIRAEILRGDPSFLQAVAAFYGAGEDEDQACDKTDQPAESFAHLPEGLSKAELQQACTQHGIGFRNSWSKSRLREALEAAQSGAHLPELAGSIRSQKAPRLSRAARELVANLTLL